MLALLEILCLVSCSVKEDRSPCPCVLDVDLSDCSGIPGGFMVSGWKSGQVFRQHYYPYDSPSEARYSVPRGILRVTAVSSLPDVGGMPDSLYAGGEDLILEDEFNSCRMRMHKQFATIDLYASKLTSDGCRCRIEVQGNYDGITIPGLAPRRGVFIREAIPLGDGVWRIAVPRQGDDRLVARVIREDGIVCSVGIGEALRSCGYDWEREDLSDVRLTLEACDEAVKVFPEEWKEVKTDLE